MPTDQKAQLQRAADAFLLDKEVQGCTRLTLVWYRDYIGRLLTWLAAHDVTTPAGITLDLLRAYMVDVQGRGLAAKTVHHHAAAAKTFCRWLAAEGLVTADPAERLPRPKVPKKVLPALAPGDVQKLLTACECERDTALLLFMLDTGARCAETVAVNIGDVDTKTGAVTIVKGKGQKGRVVFLGARSRRALLRYLLVRGDTGAAAALWISLTSGERLTTWGVTLILRRLGDRAGVHAHPHMLRRTFAIASLRAGMDVARVAALLGHSDLSAVQRYLAIADSDLADAHRAHGAVDSMLAKKGR
jgi:site-specific recombinase XerD